MTLVRNAALGLLFALPFSALGQAPWTPLWSVPALPRAYAGPMPVGTDNGAMSGWAIDLQGHTLVAYDLASGGARWSVALQPDAEYNPGVAAAREHIAIARGGVLEIRRLSDGGLVRTVTLGSAFINGLAIRGDRIHVGEQVFTWPEGELTVETSVRPDYYYNGAFSENARYYVGETSFVDLSTNASKNLTGRMGRFSTDSARVYSFLDTNNSSYPSGAVFAQSTSNGSPLWTYQSSKIGVASALPLSNGFVLVIGRYFGAQNGRGIGVMVVLNGKTGKVVSTLDTPDYTASDLERFVRITASSPVQGRAVVMTRSNGNWVSRRVDVDGSGAITVSPVDIYKTGDGVDFAGERAVVYAPTLEANNGPLSTVYKPDGAVAWQAALYPRGAWPWLANSTFYGGTFTAEGGFGATLGTDSLPRTFNGLSGAVLATGPVGGVASQFLFPLDGAHAIGDEGTKAIYYQKTGKVLKALGEITNGVPIGTDLDGKRFVVAGRNLGEIFVFQSKDGKTLATLPAGSLEQSGHPRAVLNGDTLTTLTVTQPSGTLNRVTATVWNLAGTSPTKVRTVTRDLVSATGVEFPYGVAAALSPDGRQLLLQQRFSGAAPRKAFELIRMADGKTVDHLSLTTTGDPVLDIAISKSGSRALLAVENGAKSVMAMPGVVGVVEVKPVSRKQAQVTVRLLAPAPPEGAPIRFRFTPNLATPPATTVVAGGTTKATFRVALSAVSTNTTLKIEAAAVEDDWASTTLGLGAPVVSALSVIPTSVKGGTAAKLRIALDGPAPQGGLQVALTSDKAFVTPPATVTIPAGVQKFDVAISTQAVAQTGVATIKAGDKTATLTVTP